MIRYFEQIPLWSDWTGLGFLGYVLFRVTSEKQPGQTAACLEEAGRAGGGRRDLRPRARPPFPAGPSNERASSLGSVDPSDFTKGLMRKGEVTFPELWGLCARFPHEHCLWRRSFPGEERTPSAGPDGSPVHPHSAPAPPASSAPPRWPLS